MFGLLSHALRISIIPEHCKGVIKFELELFHLSEKVKTTIGFYCHSLTLPLVLVWKSHGRENNLRGILIFFHIWIFRNPYFDGLVIRSIYFICSFKIFKSRDVILLWLFLRLFSLLFKRIFHFLLFLFLLLVLFINKYDSYCFFAEFAQLIFIFFLVRRVFKWHEIGILCRILFFLTFSR